MGDVAEPSLFYLITNHQAISCLTFVGGFIDTAGYVMLYQLFTSSITGNIVAAVQPLYSSAPGVSTRILVWIFLGLGAFTVTAISMKLRFATLCDKWQIGMILFSLEVVGLFLAMVIGGNLSFPHVESWQVILAAGITSFTMGVQNGAAMIMIPNCPATTAMTGNNVRVFIYGAEALNFYIASRGYIHLYPEKAGKPKDYEKTMKIYSEELSLKFQFFCSALGPFIVGAIVSVPLAKTMSFWCFFVPLGMIVFLVWSMYMARGMAHLEHPELIMKDRIEEHESTVSPMFALSLAESGETAQATEQPADQEKTSFSLRTMNTTTEGSEGGDIGGDGTENDASDRAGDSPRGGQYSLIVDDESRTGVW